MTALAENVVTHFQLHLYFIFCILTNTYNKIKMTKRSNEQQHEPRSTNKLAKLSSQEPEEEERPIARHDINKAKSLLLSRLNGAALPAQLRNLDEEYNTLYKLLKQTVTSGESNSCLLIGNRGTGKTALVKTVLHDLENLENEFCVVKLNGLTETNDRLALNEIARQLVTEQEQSDRSFVGLVVFVKFIHLTY